MSKVEAYAFVESKYIDAENAKNIHIFEGYYDVQTKKFYPSNNKKSCCGNCSTKEKWYYYKIAYGTTLDERRRNVRQIAKELEDLGETVCGQCVSIFYGDDI